MPFSLGPPGTLCQVPVPGGDGTGWGSGTELQRARARGVRKIETIPRSPF